MAKNERLEKLKRPKPTHAQPSIDSPWAPGDVYEGKPHTVTTGLLTAEVAAQARKDGLLSDTPQRRPDAKKPHPPHGTEYYLLFDETTDGYFGRMEVPGHEPIVGTARGRRELIRIMDRAYLASQPKEDQSNGQ